MTPVHYTCIVRGHDPYRPLPVASPGWRHVLFTDDVPTARRRADGWEVRPLAHTLRCPVRTARWHKHHPFELFPAAPVSVWIDASHWPKGDLNLLLNDGADLTLFRHPTRTTVFDEALEVIRLAKDDPKVVARTVSRYRKDGFPDDCGLYNTTLLLRHARPRLVQFQPRWWDELVRGSRRDQISLPYCLWRYPRVAPQFCVIPWDNRRENPYLDFDLVHHGVPQLQGGS